MHQTQLTHPIRPLTHREGLTYSLIGAILLLLIAFSVILFQLLVGPSEWFDLGTIDTLQAEIARQGVPLHRTVTLRNNRTLAVWVDSVDGKWVVFDGQVPFGDHRCQYEWLSLTQRYEDPCSGARFARTGEYLDIYTYLRGKTVQNLDRYFVTIRDDHVLIDANLLIHAATFVARAPTPECCGP